jgi:hypothetical protein
VQRPGYRYDRVNESSISDNAEAAGEENGVGCGGGDLGYL